MTKSEIRLWQKVLRAGQIGEQFKRQRPTDYYILDFYCTRLRIAIELDGYTHHFDEAFLYDKRRDRRLAFLGIKTIRIDSKRVFTELENVRKEIYHALKDRAQELDLEFPSTRKRKG